MILVSISRCTSSVMARDAFHIATFISDTALSIALFVFLSIFPLTFFYSEFGH